MEVISTPLFNFHIFLAFFFMSSSVISITIIATDGSALLALKHHITDDPANILATNWTSSTPVCNWIGVTCGDSHQRVTALNISFMSLTGTIPPQISNLSFLIELRIRNNSFHGSLPSQLAALRRLKLFSIGSNNFSGQIPSWFGSFPNLETLAVFDNHFEGTIPISLFNNRKLINLDLDGNALEGTIPKEIGNLINLEVLLAERNQISGSLPSALFNISSLRTLDLSNNLLQGHIPMEIGNLARLEMLKLNMNQFSGSIPSTIFNISTLQMINLSYNNLTGSLPKEMCQNLPSLEELRLSHNELVGTVPSNIWKCRELGVVIMAYNRLGGSIPASLGNMTALTKIYLSYNNFTGKIPSEIGKLNKLELFVIEFASLSGQIPSSVFNISSLKQLSFYSNNLSGTLPVDMWYQLPLLELLDLQYNYIEGSIPRGIGNCTFLSSFGLAANRLTGSIPEDIGELNYLTQVGLGLNNLVGPIPEKLFNSSMLMFLSISANQLSGSLPSDLGLNLPSLQLIYLGGNGLSGTIPSSIANASMLSVLDIAQNSFTGFVPNTLGNLRNLQWLNLMTNNLTLEPSTTAALSFFNSLANCRQLQKLFISSISFNDFLPSSIGNLSSSLVTFHASNCDIKGYIPKEIGNLNNLFELKLDGNSFNGSIPSTLGGLASLQGLALNDNALKGAFPQELCQLTNLAELNLSINQLSGSIPSCLGTLTRLRKLSLDSNKFTSTVPSTLWNLRDLLALNLSSNLLLGNLPPQIENLKSMISLDLSKNEFSGSIASTIGGLQLSLLSFADNRFQGPIPQSLGKLISLEFLDLSKNNLSGEIPKSLEALVYLKYMNVSYNRLQGEIPSGGPFTKFTDQSFFMNDALCGSQLEPCKSITHREKRTKLQPLKYVLPVFASLMFILICIFAFLRFHRRKKVTPPQTDLLLISSQTRISYHELLHATNRLDNSNLLGKGSYGSVYKGVLYDGTIIACKVFNLEVEEAFKSFDVECEVLRNIRHRNIVKIISSCSNIDMKALILEYVPNKSLENWLYSHNYCLDILQRVNIMIDVASALEYLHHGYSSTIVHCDLKPSNVLIDEDMVAHVGDFGIAKLLGEGVSAVQTRTLATIGYTAPEYGADGIVSTSGDVYSYGIMLMETFTRKRPTDEMFSVETSLKTWVSDALNGSIIEIIDSNLLRQEDDIFAVKEQILYSILNLAMECTRDLPEERIDMKNMVTRLEKCRDRFMSKST